MAGYTTYTALYDNRADAESMQAELQKLGIVDADGHSLHGGESYAAEQNIFAGGKGVVPPEPDQHLYHEALKRGGYLLTVNVDEQYADRVHTMLEGSPAVDVEAREQQYRKEGVLPAVAATAPAAMPKAAAPKTDRVGDDTIQLVEEKLVVGKRQVERGGVRVRSYVVETPVHEQVSLREEHVELERRPVNQPLTGAAADAFKERDISLTERSEEAVIAKDARVVEEIALRKDVTERTETVNDTVRRTEVEVEKLADRDRTPRTPR